MVKQLVSRNQKKLFIARHVDVFLTLGLFVEALKIQMEAQACA